MKSPATFEESRSRHSERTIEKSVLPILGFILGLVTLLGLVFVALPQLLRTWVESRLTSIFVHRVELDNLNLNILSGHMTLGGLRVRSHQRSSDLAVIRQINADVDMSALFNQQVSFKRLEIISPQVLIVRTEDRTWTLPAIAKRRAAPDSKSKVSITIWDAVLQNGSLIIENRSISPMRTERLDDIQLTLKELSLASSVPARVHGSAQVSDSGTIVIDGTVLSNLHSGSLKVDLTEISLAPLGGVSGHPFPLQGRVTAHLSVTWPGTVNSPVEISGDLVGQDIALSPAGHRMGHAATVSASKVEVTWPDTVAVDRLLVNKPEIWVRRNESGHFVGFRTGADSTQPVSAATSHDDRFDSATTSTQWRIGKVVVRSGTVHLEDQFVRPAYSDVLQNLELTLDDVMSTADHAVMINARADIASGGALDLQGRAALFGSSPSASLKAAIHRFVVPSTNSYLKRAISHYTTDGTLTTLMDIRLIGDKLEVLSDVTLSDLEVEPVGNATHRTVQERIGLPLGLLIALLKDETGRIVITFPISGPLSNPTFDWTNAIWATIRNAVVKLFTFPIRSIGRFIMGHNELDTLVIPPITFDPGSTIILPAMDRKLHDLAKLLSTEKQTVLHMTPILSSTDLGALQHMPSRSWPVPELDTAETARHVLAVRRAYLVAARLAGLGKVPSGRLPVDPPRRDMSEAGQSRVELQLEKGGGATDRVLSGRER